MAIKVAVTKNAYHDSVTLMAISGQVKAVAGVSEAVVSMATAMNKELLQSIGLLTDEAAACGPDDMVVAVRAEDAAICEAAVNKVEEFLSRRTSGKKSVGIAAPPTIAAAVRMMPEANLAIISVPGAYAAREAALALKQGLHVMMFSDNVSLQEEKRLKELAHEKGLLMMGPDCGTAIINGTPLCFANAVHRGNIGIVGASGTGTQEVTVQIDHLGGGVSQVLGTGGRDLKEDIGGIMMLDCLSALAADKATEVIVLISKPPAAAVADKILREIKKCGKPAVICFLGAVCPDDEQNRIWFSGTLEEAAHRAGELAGVKPGAKTVCGKQTRRSKSPFPPGQKAVRGLFCGGTLCEEARHIIQQGSDASEGHTFIDLGDDEYTLGRPHPMIEPGLRLPHILAAASDPSVAVILLDFVIGYGSHADPAGLSVPTLAEARRSAAVAGRRLEIVAYVCGTDKDPQGRTEQENKLLAAGILTASSNAAAARLAAAVIKGE